jgi:protein tyrosine/serine phosphatase
MTNVIPEILFRSARPGYDGKEVSQAEVDAWIAKAKAHGIQTILCLLDDPQLAFYTAVPGGLLDYYRQAGFAVIARPVKDYQFPEVSSGMLATVHADFLGAAKPLLVHCSAGIVRTGAVIRHLLRKHCE